MDSAPQELHNSASGTIVYGTGPYTFDVDCPLLFGEVFHIQLEEENCIGKVFPMRVTVTQKNYNQKNPNWYSVCFSEEYTGVPMGDYYDIDYRDSTTSSMQSFVYYFNDKLHHNHLKHVTVEALNTGPEAAY